jgi:hypothetical protein
MNRHRLVDGFLALLMAISSCSCALQPIPIPAPAENRPPTTSRCEPVACLAARAATPVID